MSNILRPFRFLLSGHFLAALLIPVFMLPGMPSNGMCREETEKVDSPGHEDAKSQRFELQEIVVTATREEDEVTRVPKNVTVITALDIEQAPSNNVVDLLSREANVTLRSFFGSDKKAGVDIRGMGDTFVSNVIVMVDGFRLNSPDLSGPDFSSIPLGQIERIEIVRGAGSVLYGDGAVGGVINIITKRGAKDKGVILHGTYGSYDTHEGGGQAIGAFDGLSASLNGGYYSSEGYRDNGYLRKKDAGFRLGYEMKEHLSLSLGASIHDDRYGLPGPVSKEDVGSEDRRTRTAFLNDFGETEDRRYFGSAVLDFMKLGKLSTHFAYRDRKNPYIMGFNALLPKEMQTDTISEETIQINMDYSLPLMLKGLEHMFKLGVDYFETDYVREEISRRSMKNSDVKTLAWFVTGECSITKSLLLSGGYRRSKFAGSFREDTYEDFYAPPPPPPPFFPPTYLYSEWVLGEVEKKTWRNHAFDIGLVYSMSPQASLFVDYAKSFRIPNVDELALADDDLTPQRGLHLDIGARHRVDGLLEVAATLFQIQIEDEIYYGEDPATKTTFNRNYDDTTVRRGVETDVKWYPSASVYLWGNLTYMEAVFEGTDRQVPLVPEFKASLGVEWRITNSLLLSLTGTAVGARYDGNDETNLLYEKLEAYQVVDGKLTYETRNFKIFGGVNNILNELYSTASYSETYYPMPTRNAYVGMEVRF